MGDAGHQVALEIGEDVGHGLRLVRRGGGQLGGDLAGCGLGADRVFFDLAHVVGHPVDELVGVGAEFIGGHGHGFACGNGRICASVS